MKDLLLQVFSAGGSSLFGGGVIDHVCCGK